MASGTSKPKQQGSLFSEVLHLLGKILLIAAFLGLFGTLLFKGFRNTDTEMLPALKHGDLVFCYRLDKNYAFSDVIAFSYQGENQLRRVIAVAGDTVDITEEGLQINGWIVVLLVGTGMLVVIVKRRKRSKRNEKKKE